MSGTLRSATTLRKLRRRAESCETRLDLVGAWAPRKLLQVSTISLDGGVFLTSLLLGTCEVEQQIFVVEVGRFQAAKRRLITLHRLGGVLFGFPGVSNASPGERSEGWRRRPRHGD